MGTTAFSCLARGLLTGKVSALTSLEQVDMTKRATMKYNDGIPAGSRYDTHSISFDRVIKQLKSPEGQEQIRKVRELTQLAESGPWFSSYSMIHPSYCSPELNTTPQALALAWVARNPNTSTVILGVSDVDQLRENLQALQVLPKLTPEIMDKIEAILDNKPQPPVSALIES